jgi:hypothetical protein
MNGDGLFTVAEVEAYEEVLRKREAEQRARDEAAEKDKNN